MISSTDTNSVYLGEKLYTLRWQQRMEDEGRTFSGAYLTWEQLGDVERGNWYDIAALAIKECGQ